MNGASPGVGSGVARDVSSDIIYGVVMAGFKRCGVDEEVSPGNGFGVDVKVSSGIGSDVDMAGFKRGGVVEVGRSDVDPRLFVLDVAEAA